MGVSRKHRLNQTVQGARVHISADNCIVICHTGAANEGRWLRAPSETRLVHQTRDGSAYGLFVSAQRDERRMVSHEPGNHHSGDILGRASDG